MKKAGYILVAIWMVLQMIINMISSHHCAVLDERGGFLDAQVLSLIASEFGEKEMKINVDTEVRQ